MRIGVLGLVLLCGCASDTTGGAPGPDGGAGDVGVVDAQTPDAGADTEDVAAPDVADGAGDAGADVADSAGVGDSADSGGPDAGADSAGMDAGDAAVTDAGPPDDTADASDAESEPPLPSELTGRILVIQNAVEGEATGGYVNVDLRDGPVPSSQVVTKEAGDCRLIVGDIPDALACEPACEPGLEQCVGGACLAFPKVAPSGTVTVSGLAEPLTFEPDDFGYPAAYGLEPPVFWPGATIAVTSPGDVTPALDLAAKGTPTLDADPLAWKFTPGEDYVVTWVPVASEGRIQLLVQTGWHGSPNLTSILCETEDTGTLVVPAALTEGFPIPSCGKCEVSTLSRFTRDVVDHGQGPIELFVASQVQFIAWWGGR